MATMTLDSLDNPTQSYRISFSTLFLWTLVALFLLHNAKTLIVESMAFNVITILQNLSLITILSLLNSGILVWMLKGEISVKGISSFNSWGGGRVCRLGSDYECANIEFPWPRLLPNHLG